MPKTVPGPLNLLGDVKVACKRQAHPHQTCPLGQTVLCPRPEEAAACSIRTRALESESPGLIPDSVTYQLCDCEKVI